jgi:hypothetical protein
MTTKAGDQLLSERWHIDRCPAPRSEPQVCTCRGALGMAVRDIEFSARDQERARNAKREALAATPAPLDVERLARAMHRTENPDGGECSDLMGKHGRWARNLAAAYAEEADRD